MFVTIYIDIPKGLNRRQREFLEKSGETLRQDGGN